jgi:hypothetical protein
MSVSQAELANTTDLVNEPVTQAAPAAPAVAAPSTEVLITTQEVLFSTAAAQGLRRDHTDSRFGDIFRRFFAAAASWDAPSSQPRHYPRRYGYYEDALMSREMDRL